MNKWTLLQRISILQRRHFKLPYTYERERGSVVVIVALGLTTLLGLGALVTDIGMFYAQKAKLQNAVDASALAGVQELPKNPTSARTIAQDYASKNDTSNITVTLNTSNSKITVVAEKKVPTYLAKIWGIREGNLSAKASAMIVPPTALVGAAPLSIEKQEFIYGVPYTLKSGAGQIELSGRYKGWFGALQLGGSGASTYFDNLKYGYQKSISIGDIIQVEDGNMSGPTQQGVKARLDWDTRVPPNTFDNYDRKAPQILYVPVVEIVSREGGAVHSVKIVGFASFFLEGVTFNGDGSIITGRFIKTLVPNNQSSGSLSDLLRQEEQMSSGTSSTNFGLFTSKLVDH
jgi:hypothetical protein